MFQVLLPSHEPWVFPSVLMLARALEKEGVRLIKSPLCRRPFRAMGKAAGSMRLGRMPMFRSKQAAFFHINHPWANGLYPYRMFNQCVTFSFDCWAPLYDQWTTFFIRTKPTLAFISAKASVADMARRCHFTEFRWLPEAIDPAVFRPNRPLVAREIDVLEIGRRYRTYHDSVESALRRAGCRHVYPATDGQIAFSHAECIELYANSKVALCFPKTITHPEIAGGVETITFRYWEAIASKCVVVGHCPEELRQIMGYNPVIEVDMEEPARQLQEILVGINRFQETVDRNHERLSQVWTVEHQAATIRQALAEIESRQA